MKECCANCKFFHAKNGRSWVTKYYCIVDGDDRLLGRFDNYTGHATNKARIELESRCCRNYEERDER